ncbi:MAG: hypothetical protein IJ783_02420, partial [Kiritimatiellae bacterium]|nr:hypothetical protein [Kiritimatiellia bacterium]
MCGRTGSPRNKIVHMLGEPICTSCLREQQERLSVMLLAAHEADPESVAGPDDPAVRAALATLGAGPAEEEGEGASG